MTTPEQLKEHVRDVPGYPKAGIVFRDITPLLGRKDLFREVVEMMSKSWSSQPPDLVAAIEARGFIPGAAMAQVGIAGRVRVEIDPAPIADLVAAAADAGDVGADGFPEAGGE